MLFIPFLFLITLLYPPVLKDIFIPSFLYCWPAAQSLSAAVIQSLQRKVYRVPNNFKLEVIRLVIFLVCFIFTWYLAINFMRGVVLWGVWFQEPVCRFDGCG